MKIPKPVPVELGNMVYVPRLVTIDCPDCSAEVRLDRFLGRFPRSGRNDKSGRPPVAPTRLFFVWLNGRFPVQPRLRLCLLSNRQDGVPQVTVWRPLGKLYLRNQFRL